MWWGKADKQTAGMQAFPWQGPCLLCTVSPLASGFQLWGSSWLLLLPDRGRACQKENRSDFICLSPSISDKRSNSVLLSLDRNTSFFADSNLTLPYKITWNWADFYVSSYYELTDVPSNKGKLWKLWKDKLITLLTYTGVLIPYVYYLILFLLSQLVLSDFAKCQWKGTRGIFTSFPFLTAIPLQL